MSNILEQGLTLHDGSLLGTNLALAPSAMFSRTYAPPDMNKCRHCYAAIGP